MMQVMSFLTAAALLIIGLWAVVYKDNLIKKVMGLTFITDAVNLTLITMGYNEGGIVPIRLPGTELVVFSEKAAFALPQALVLTNIVIGVATISLILGLCIKIHNEKKTLSSRRIWTDER